MKLVREDYNVREYEMPYGENVMIEIDDMDFTVNIRTASGEEIGKF